MHGNCCIPVTIFRGHRRSLRFFGLSCFSFHYRSIAGLQAKYKIPQRSLFAGKRRGYYKRNIIPRDAGAAHGLQRQGRAAKSTPTTATRTRNGTGSGGRGCR
eukprot:IDg11228t1